MPARTFKNLRVWKQGHKLVLRIYKLTDSFPSHEQFGLTSQIRRSAISVTSNIAEGFGRRNPKEKTQFYYMSTGSLAELINQLTIAFDLGYITESSYKDTEKLAQETYKLLNALIKANKSKYKVHKSSQINN